jgi:uncharacterized protein YjeT (DUF2065 family)
MRETVFLAIGLVFVIEGILPFLSPHSWRQMMNQMSKQNDRTIRLFGLVSMIIGLVIVYFIHR